MIKITSKHCYKFVILLLTNYYIPKIIATITLGLSLFSLLYLTVQADKILSGDRSLVTDAIKEELPLLVKCAIIGVLTSTTAIITGSFWFLPWVTSALNYTADDSILKIIEVMEADEKNNRVRSIYLRDYPVRSNVESHGQAY
jgi:hypothetical protein